MIIFDTTGMSATFMELARTENKSDTDALISELLQGPIDPKESKEPVLSSAERLVLIYRFESNILITLCSDWLPFFNNTDPNHSLEPRRNSISISPLSFA